jgi:short-subunit dehydrogenase
LELATLVVIDTDCIGSCFVKNSEGSVNYNFALYITGSGIGRLISLRFAKLGCRLVLWDVNEKGNEETAKLIKAIGAYVKSYTVDLSKREELGE